MTNVGLDITALIYKRGVSRYTANLIYALLDEPEVRVSLLGYSWRQKNWLEKKTKRLLANYSQGQAVVKPYPPSLMGWFWRLGLMPVGRQLSNLDLFHSWDWLQPPDKNLPLVSTVHDLSMLRFPETTHPKILKKHKRAWSFFKKRQTRLIAVSQTTKKDLIELLGYPGYLIDVVHEALPLEVRATSDALTEDRYRQIMTEHQLDKPYILFVGTREPRKNLKRLIEAWRPLANDYQLLVVGEKGWDETSTGQVKTDQNLRFLGFVDDEVLSVLYAEAAVFAYPSLYEGFGLPILEAFHHGTPVVTSDLSAMVEVAGNAAELVNPLEVESIRHGLQVILEEDILSQKKRLQRMIIRQQMFDWRHVATQTVAVYKKAIEEFDSQ